MTNQITIGFLENWLHTQIRIGARCGNCDETFTAARPAKGIAGFANGAGQSIYVLCLRCAHRFKRQGPTGIPNAVKDAKLAGLLHFMPTKGRA